MTFGDTVNENVQESLIHKAVQQSCLVASGHASIRDQIGIYLQISIYSKK